MSGAHAFTPEDVDFLAQVASPLAAAGDQALDARQVTASRVPLAEETLSLAGEMRTEHNFAEIIGRSRVLTSVLKDVETVAPTEATVLVLGETGTRKELIARALHTRSPRRQHPFVKINCAAIPLGLLESELFGHEKGAFTGTVERRLGRFELADKGTLFLDEIGDIPLELQSKLLRVLQEHEFERLGSSQTRRVDVRLVTATNKDLAQMTEVGHFRGDLYYRLHIFPLHLPPLRERTEDIPLLVRSFAHTYAQRLHKRIDTIPVEAMEALCRYAWPGNVRELQNVIERAVILASDAILRPSLPAVKPSLPPACLQGKTLADVEREHMLRVLQDTCGVVGGPSGAAVRLGLKRTTLQSRMEKLGIARVAVTTACRQSGPCRHTVGTAPGPGM
jgi:formate hydrogenlyase transcriptional activator